MNQKPWREIAIPHEDVLKGTFQQAEFAADLSRVHDGTATPEYQDAALFFQRTYITEGMRLLLDSVVRRLGGRGGDPVIQLQTAFGGGKTHTMLAVYHVAKGATPAGELAGIPPILDAAGVTEAPRAAIAVIDGNALAPNMPATHGGVTVNTMWGSLARQLGGEAGYAMVREADESGTSPGKDVLARLLQAYAPCVILIDELVAYIRQFDEGKSYSGGTYDSNLSFIQALTEALKAVPTAVLLASLPESDKEAGSRRGVSALKSLEHYFGRVQALWKPVATEEGFEIVRRRLFESIGNPAAAEAVCRAFADHYTANGADLPPETQEARYLERMRSAYPIHPEVFDRLYDDWSTLENFQRTRGVLKLMAKVIHRLWTDGNNDMMIMPGSLPLYDPDVKNESIYYLPPGWDPVIEGDIDGERAETTRIENTDTLMGSVQACRRAARTIFLGSAPTTSGQMARGIEAKRILLGCLQPGQQISRYEDALKRLVDRLHYLNSGNDRFWFDTRPNLRREMEERKKRFASREDIYPAVRERLQKMLAAGSFAGVHVFTPSADVPDDWGLRLVALPPDTPFTKAGHSPAIERATEILRGRGDQPRQKQNRLIFLAADADGTMRLDDLVRSTLAWKSIVSDIEEMKLNLDQLQSRQARQELEKSVMAMQRMVAEAYRWLLTPVQDAEPGAGISEIRWEHFPLTTGAPNMTQEIVRVLRDNELVIMEWSPIHLSMLLRNWFWKEDAPDVGAQEVWQKTCQYLYMPRLQNDEVFRNAIANGTGNGDYFGLADGKENGSYKGFSFAREKSPVLDGALQLIEPKAARAYVDALPPLPGPGTWTGPGSGPIIAEPPIGGGSETGGPLLPPPPVPTHTKRRFYGTIDLDPIQAKKQFSDIVDEILVQFTTKLGVNVTVSVEIHAESADGFDQNVQRAVKENATVLKFGGAGFEE